MISFFNSTYCHNAEQWLEALGHKGATTDQMPAWRRAHMSNLLNAFDFDHVSLYRDPSLLLI